jgi:hypothetical protein
MVDSATSSKIFDYTSLDAETSQFLQQQTSEIRVLMKRTVQGIFEIGQKLIEVKKRLGYGRFGSWLQAEFNWDERTARRFMSVASRFGGKLDKLSEINFAPSALYLLAAPSTPEVARSEAITLAREGEPITYTVAKAIKQKHNPPPIKLKPEPEPGAQPQATPTPTLPLESRSKLQIVAIRPQGQVPVAQLPEVAKEKISRSTQVPQVAQTLSVTQPIPPVVHAPKQFGTWWQLGAQHLLYYGEPNSPEFQSRITEKVQLLLAFPSTLDWQHILKAKTSIIVTNYLPPGKNLEQFDEVLESLVLFYSRLGDLVVSCFLPLPKILSILNRLDRRGMIAEPDVRRVNEVISDWKRAGMKVERLNQVR